MDPNNVMVQFERDVLYSLEIKSSYMPFFCCLTMSLMNMHLLDTIGQRPNRRPPPPPPQNTSWSPFIEVFAKACIFLLTCHSRNIVYNGIIAHECMSRPFNNKNNKNKLLSGSKLKSQC